MNPHAWVCHTITPVDVYLDSENNVQVLMDPELKDITEASNVAYGCNDCGVELTNQTYNTPCSGDGGE